MGDIGLKTGLGGMARRLIATALDLRQDGAPTREADRRGEGGLLARLIALVRGATLEPDTVVVHALAIPLPPRRARPTAANVARLSAGLTSVIAGQPKATTTWTFYEVVDAYLGPWGEDGYPIAYGVHYDKLFNGNVRLKANPITRDFCEKVTVGLQEALRDFIVTRFQAGTLGSLTEPELRAAAFESHSDVYTKAGLSMVILRAPWMLPVIASVPYAEFDPRSANFLPTIREVFEMLEDALPEVGEELTDFDEDELARRLVHIEALLDNGALDNIAWLERITDALERRLPAGSPVAAMAREVREEANERKRIIAAIHQTQVDIHAGLRETFDRLMPTWRQYLPRGEEAAAGKLAYAGLPEGGGVV